jgi:hypothetical protein
VTHARSNLTGRTVWTQGPNGWTKTRAKVPRAARSERVPRPPEHRKHRAEDGAALGYSARELRDGLRGLIDPNLLRGVLVQAESAAEAIARLALVPAELAQEVTNRVGPGPLAFALVMALGKTSRKRKRKAKR